MDRDQLRLRLIDAFNRHWRANLDRNGPTPAYIDELAAIAEEHAPDHPDWSRVAGYKVGDQIYHPDDVMVMLHSPGLSEPVPPPARAAESGGGGGGDELDAPPLVVTPVSAESRTVGARSPGARTRTRTRGGAGK